MKIKSISNILLALVILAILAYLLVIITKAFAPRANIIQGQIEATQYNASSKIPGRIEKLFVKKGDMVQKGDLIYIISSPEIDAKLVQAKAGLAAAKAVSNEANSPARAETITSTKDLYGSAKSMSELARKSYERIKALYEEGVVSLQKKDEAFSLYTSAKYKENIAYQQYLIALKGAKDDTKKAFKEKERLAGGILQEVQSFAKDTKVYAPTDGEISNILLHGGELAPLGFPVVLITDMKKAYVHFALLETYLSKIKKGSKIKGFIPALNASYDFTIHNISVMGSFATWNATRSSNSYDLKTFEIEAYPTQKIENLRVGMSVLIDAKQFN